MTAAAEQPGRKAVPTVTAWMAVGGALMGTFMALLDISVTNASLPQIQGEIGATGTEGTWIGTAYLAAEIVMIPLTGWFSRLLGLRRFLIIAGLLFLVFSVVCGLAGTLTQMIIGRVGQGFAGGAMIPAGLTIIATRLTAQQRPLGFGVYATVAVIAPVIGPILGGWLTENFAWQWVFYINLPLIIPQIVMLTLGIADEPVQPEELRRADWLGIAGLALSLGGLTVMLEEGQRENWFDSDLIVILALTAGLGAALVLYSQMTHPHPVAKLRLLLTRSYGAVFFLITVMGASAITMLYLVPVFLGGIASYNAQQTGFVMVYTGLGTFLIMPLATVLMARLDLRILVALGMVAGGAGCLLCLGLTADSVGLDFAWPLYFNGLGITVAAMPLSQAATVGLAERDIPDGTALFSMGRNVGGSLGLAATGVLLDRRLEFHTTQLEQATTANSTLAQDRVAELTAMMAAQHGDAALAQLQALKLIAGEIQRQSLVMSFVDGFWVMGVAFLLAIPAVLLLRGGAVGAAGGGAH